ncbi:MAG: hypothetical protein LBP73_11755 [Clostridiales Family XIII bacterium]|jgi:hypothetical protein|nr:hypothetical protein [Clostridiales Family XIII bacterium]
MTGVYRESELIFDFSRCLFVERCDAKACQGMKSVDFMVDTGDRVCFIEVKNFAQTNAPQENRERDYKMLTDKNAVFPLEIGMKIKDSLLKKYAEGYVFEKPIVALLVLKLDKLYVKQFQKLHDRIRGYVPTGLNKGYTHFSKIEFKISKTTETKEYGFTVASAE